MQFFARVLAFVALLVASPLVLSGCAQNPPNVPDSKDLCLSTSSSDFQSLNYEFSEIPVADDDLSVPLAPNPLSAGGDFETGYSRIFYTHEAIHVDGMDVELPRGFPLWNAVRVYDSVEKAKRAFTDMDPPRFVFHTQTGRAGKELQIPLEGDESGAWYYAREVVDEDNSTSTTEIDAQIRFRVGNTISDIGVATWYGNPDATATLLLDLARVSNRKIADTIYAP